MSWRGFWKLEMLVKARPRRDWYEAPAPPRQVCRQCAGTAVYRGINKESAHARLNSNQTMGIDSVFRERILIILKGPFRGS